MESFLSIQGEGGHQGKTAHFIRLAGCDVGCPWCDVPESWETSDHETRTILDLSQEVQESPAPFVVVTGGEPAMHNLTHLTEAIHEHKRKSHIETSGAYPLTGVWDWVCLSPKKAKLPIQDAYNHAHELKIIIYNNHDFKFAEQEAKKVNKNAILYLQPEWGKREKMMPLMVDFIKKNPKWKISLQTHKYLNIP